MAESGLWKKEFIWAYDSRELKMYHGDSRHGKKWSKLDNNIFNMQQKEQTANRGRHECPMAALFPKGFITFPSSTINWTASIQIAM